MTPDLEIGSYGAVPYRGASDRASAPDMLGMQVANARLRGVGDGDAVGTNPAIVPLRTAARSFHPYDPTHGGSDLYQAGLSDAMDAGDPTFTYTNVERVQTVSMSVQDHTMTRAVIDEANRRHGQYQQAVSAAHEQSVAGVVALAREALRAQHGILSEEFAREEASLDGQRRTELAEMYSQLTADHQGRLAMVEQQANALVEANHQHESESYMLSMRRMHDEMIDHFNSELEARNLAVQDNAYLELQVHEYHAQCLSLQQDYCGQLNEASVTHRRVMSLEASEMEANHRIGELRHAVTQELEEESEAIRAQSEAMRLLQSELLEARAHTHALQQTIVEIKPIPRTPPEAPALPAVDGTPLRMSRSNHRRGPVATPGGESYYGGPPQAIVDEFKIHGSTADEYSSPMSSVDRDFPRSNKRDK